MMAIVDDSLIFASPTPVGFTYTLASRLGQMLQMVESEFGPLDKSYTILGIEFRDGVPQVWFPDKHKCCHIVIQLSREAMQEPVRALWQLAHESVHLLDPHPGGGNVLEEGVAAHFAVRYLAQLNCSFPTGDPRYDEASSLVEQLLAARPGAIRELRAQHGPLHSVTAAQISAVCPGVECSIAERLARDF